MPIVAYVIRSNHGPRPYSAFTIVPGTVQFVPVESSDASRFATFISVGDAQRAVQQTRGGNIMRWDQVQADGDGIEKWTSNG